PTNDHRRVWLVTFPGTTFAADAGEGSPTRRGTLVAPTRPMGRSWPPSESPASRLLDDSAQPRIEEVPQRVAEQIERHDREDDRQAGEDDQPPWRPERLGQDAAEHAAPART